MRSGRGTLGILIGLVGVLISSSAWALDLDQEIQKQQQVIEDVVPTLGHGVKPQSPDNVGSDSLKVQLVRPSSKRARSS